MQSIIACPSCRGPLALSSEHVGQPVRCPRCGTVFRPTAPPAPQPVPGTSPEPEGKAVAPAAPPREAPPRKPSSPRLAATDEATPPVPAGLKGLAMLPMVVALAGIATQAGIGGAVGGALWGVLGGLLCGLALVVVKAESVPYALRLCTPPALTALGLLGWVGVWAIFNLTPPPPGPRGQQPFALQNQNPAPPFPDLNRGPDQVKDAHRGHAPGEDKGGRKVVEEKRVGPFLLGGSDAGVERSPDGRLRVKSSRRSHFALSPDGRRVIRWSPGPQGDLSCIEVGTARTLWHRGWPGGLGDIRVVVPLPDGKHGLAVDHTAQRVKVALTPEAKDGEEVQESDKKVAFGGEVAGSADGKRFASIGEGERLHVFDADSWAEGPTTQLQPGKQVAALVLSRDGKYAAAGCEDHLVQVADVAAGGPAHRVQLPRLDLGFNTVKALAFSGDNRFLVAGRGPTVYLVDLAAGRKVTVLHDHPKERRDALIMSAVAVSPDGDLIASAAYRGELRLWSRKAGRVVAELANATDSPHDSVTGLAFTPDGATLLLSYESQLDIWPVHRLLAAHKK